MARNRTVATSPSGRGWSERNSIESFPIRSSMCCDCRVMMRLDAALIGTNKAPHAFYLKSAGKKKVYFVLRNGHYAPDLRFFVTGRAGRRRMEGRRDILYGSSNQIHPELASLLVD